MDRRSWLWRRKSSEKSPGETESSGSLSSLSERFSDDQAYPSQATLSPEVTSKAAPNEEVSTPKKYKEDFIDVKTLTNELAAALLDISAKEDLVKQHSKVAEEAVSGWEKAENEASSLKQQLDAARQKNSGLEDRVSHLDGALKECMRQLRQAREVQEQKIHDAIANNSHNSESKRFELERKVAELEAQLQTSKADAVASIRSDLHRKLETVEKENLSLQLELQSRLEELEFRIAERDLSSQAAETASKQNLESIKKIAKLEAECRRLKAMTRKTLNVNDNRSLTTSSVYIESFTDSMSDGGEMNEYEPSCSDSCSSALISELDQFKNKKTTGKNHIAHATSTEINLMDDFLEMERLAALPDTERGSHYANGGRPSDQFIVGHSAMEAEVEAMIEKNAELKRKLERMEADKLKVETSLTECQMQLETSESRIRAAELKVEELQTQLALANKSNQEAYEELKETKTKKEIVESKLKNAQTEVEELISKLHSLEEDIQKERALSAENSIKSMKLEDELSRMKHEAQVQQDTKTLHKESVNRDLKSKQDKELALASQTSSLLSESKLQLRSLNSESRKLGDKELALATSKFAECQKTIASLGKQLKSLATLEDFLLEPDNNPMVLTCEVITQNPPQKEGEKLKVVNHSDLSLAKRDSLLNLNSSITNEKSRNGIGKLIPRSKSVSRIR